MNPTNIAMTADEYRELEDSYSGVCLSCGATRFGDTEPDAEGYHCDNCGEDTVSGAMTAMMDGYITITD